MHVSRLFRRCLTGLLLLGASLGAAFAHHGWRWTDDGQFELTFEGRWPDVMLWEIPALAVIMELRSRAALNRLLDENDGSLTLTTLASAAAALGKRVNLQLAPA